MPWIQLPRVEGNASRQAHADLPAGTFERELGKEGFYGPSTQMHHRHPPTAWTTIEGPLRPHAFDTQKLAPQEACPWQAALLFSNAHTQIRFLKLEHDMDHLVRNADGDDLIFVHRGAGELYCDYGHLGFREGDYLLLPRGTMWRIDVKEAVSALLIEATDHSYTLPDKGLVGQQAIFDPAVLDAPKIDEAFIAQQNEAEWRVVVKRRHLLSTLTYPFNPLDAVGWHGALMPVRLNWRDIRPLMSHRYHVPPSAHTTFVSNRFVVCTFVPRPFETDPNALNVPFFHSNDDYDELIFYHAGQFFSRDHIYPGMMTLHPSGIPHGPHPKALQNAESKRGTMTDEVAVMIDTRDALEVSEQAAAIEWPGYVDSWK
ncbi:homogentisate 1,2-dioxygenase [Methylomicrobium lacus]|uniref:homogentisate 1,2-dioxygenase n=1 Tax=Methylomicrobium lacus TaxID=136992 RepID=UPI0035A84C80